MPVGLAWYASRKRWLPAQHLLTLNEHLLALTAGDIKRLIVEMPPRHGKSTLISQYFPAWYIGRHHQPVILASYEAEFAAHWGGKARDVLREHGQELFGLTVRKDKSASNWWETTAGGSMMTAGVGGPITGKGAKLLIVDDPVKNAEEAASETYREKAWDWWRSTAYTRLEPEGVAVIVMTRWHEDDLVGRILNSEEQGKWTRLSLPAISEDGEALWPARFSLEALKETRRAIGTQYWSALYDQKPSPDEGARFKRNWWRRYQTLPAGLHLGGIFVDMAHEEKTTADYSVIATWRTNGHQFYLTDLIRERMEFPELERAVRDAQIDHKLPVYIEDTPGSKPLIQTLQRDLQGVIGRKVRGVSKLARAEAILPLVEAGNCYLPEDAPWVGEFIEEHARFPLGAHDDMVDTTSMALRQLSAGGVVDPGKFKPYKGREYEKVSA